MTQLESTYSLCDAAAFIRKGKRSQFGGVIPRPDLSFLKPVSERIPSKEETFLDDYEFDDNPVPEDFQTRAEKTLEAKLSEPYPYK